MEKKLHFTIIGSGAGGQTMGAYLAQKGYPVRMFDINKELIAKLKTLDELQAIGCFEAHGKPDVITDDIAEAMEDADIILVPSTTDAHEWIANNIRPYVRDGQMIVLFPGHMGGALLMSQILRSGPNPPRASSSPRRRICSIPAGSRSRASFCTPASRSMWAWLPSRPRILTRLSTP